MTVADILRKIYPSGKALSGAKTFLSLCSAFNRAPKPIGFRKVRGNFGAVRATLASSLTSRP